jgi:hypothetical protein
VAGCRGEDAVIADEVEPWRWDERGELFQQLEGSESDVGRTVAPAVLELVEQTSVVQAG